MGDARMQGVTTWIALLRGINVGGARKLPMADLRAILADAGCADVTTYIQSGNAVFTHAARSAPKLETDLEQAIEAATGLHVPVRLRSAAQLAAVVRGNPFPGVEPTKLVVLFLKDKPDPAALRSIDANAFAPEAFVARGREIYLHLPNGQGRAKLPQALGRIKTPATARNWQTVMKLLDLASG